LSGNEEIDQTVRPIARFDL